jgi:hypothetical protein
LKFDNTADEEERRGEKETGGPKAARSFGPEEKKPVK